MQHFKLRFDEFPAASALVRQYLSQSEALRSFYNFTPDFDGVLEALAHRTFELSKRQVLVSQLTETYAQAGLLTKAKTALIQSLAQENVFTVTTGHQLCLFGGPAYFIYKIANAIQLAKSLNERQNSKRVIPVFWMATEDHDFEEINHFETFNSKWSFEAESGGYTGEIDSRFCKPLLEQLDEIFGNGERAGFLKQLFQKAYGEQNNLANATMVLVNEIFKDEPLLIIDANRNAFKTLFKTVLERDINGEHELLLQAQTQKLAELGFASQVQIKPRNTFMLKEGLRLRIDQNSSGSFELNNTAVKFTYRELLNQLSNSPQNFSPNVMLRPLYQETILPNVAYIGGGAEVAYWLQLKPMFEHNQIPYPAVLMRSSALWISAKAFKKFEESNLTWAQIATSTDDLLKQKVLQEAATKFDVGEHIKQAQLLFDGLEQQAISINDQLKFPVRGAAKKTETLILGLQQKMIRHEKKKQQIWTNKVEAVKAEVLPRGVFQERKINFSAFYLEYGDVFFEKVKTELSATSPCISVFVA